VKEIQTHEQNYKNTIKYFHVMKETLKENLSILERSIPKHFLVNFLKFMIKLLISVRIQASVAV
jgi:hypothetical protein